MRKSAKLVIFMLCFTLFCSFPFTSYGADNSITFTGTYLGLLVNNSGNSFTDPKFDGSLNTLPTEFGVTSNQVTGINFMFQLSSNFNSGDIVTINTTSSLGGVAFKTGIYQVYEDDEFVKQISVQYSSTSIPYTVSTNCNIIDFRFYSSSVTHSGDTSTASTRLKITYNYEAADLGLLKQIINFLQTLPDKIGDFFTELKDNMSTFFTNLGNRIADNLTSLGNRLSGFFQSLGDNISGFFEKLWNRIYWGNENGEAEYEPPVFGSSLDDVLDDLDGYIQQLDDTNEQIESATDTSVAYVQQGTSVINSIFGVFPSIVTALVIFGIVFIFCRKVVGR